MCIGGCLGLGMGLGLGRQVLSLCLCFCMGVRMHMGLRLQVLSLRLSLQALSMGGKALSLDRDLQVRRLGHRLEALGMQVLSMGLHTNPTHSATHTSVCFGAFLVLHRICTETP